MTLLLNNLTWTSELYKTDNIIPSFFETSDWSSVFKYVSSSMFYIPELASISSIVGNDLPDAPLTTVNAILTLFIVAQEYLPNFMAVVIITALFAHMYSKANSVFLLNQTIKLVQCFWLVGVLYYSFYFIIRFMFVSFNFQEVVNETGLRLNSIAYESYLYNEQIYYNNVMSLAFLVVLAGLHLFANTLVINSIQISPEVPVMTYLVACFAWALLSLENFALFLVCLEGFSLTLYILATVGRLYGGISAAIKYFVFGTLGSILLYWGGISIFELTASMNVAQLSELLNTNIGCVESNGSIYSKATLAQSFILFGFLIKLGAAPLHQWIADVYAGVPLFITAFYAIFVKLALFILFLKFAVNFVSSKEIEFAALLSLIVGCFGTLRQVEIKRFLAYGSIAHTGYLLMGDLTATYVYLATYILASFVFFSILLNIKLNNHEFIYLSDLRFIGKSSNLLDRTILVIVLASMAGLPPFAGFYGKMLVWTSLMEDIYMFNDTWSFVLLLANLLTSLIMMFYYMQVMNTLYVNDEQVETNIVTSNTSLSERTANIDTIMSIQYFGVVLLVLWTFVMPQFLTTLNNLI